MQITGLTGIIRKYFFETINISVGAFLPLERRNKFKCFCANFDFKGALLSLYIAAHLEIKSVSPKSYITKCKVCLTRLIKECFLKKQ